MKVGIVTTTIGIPYDFPPIYVNAKENEHDIHMYVVGDKKTPISKVRKYLRKYIPTEDFTVLSIRNQMGFLNRQYGVRNSRNYREVFQENNYQRRIIGFLIATQEGAETIISVDDDNFPREREDFVGKHLEAIGEHESIMTIIPNTSYVNLLDFLVKEKSHPLKAYVRGFPIHLRGEIGYAFGKRSGNVAVNVGLWEKSPDVDAITRMSNPDIMVKYNSHMYPMVVDRGFYTSMCTQNLSFNTKYLVTQYEFPMNVEMEGMRLGRYDDIWGGYVCKKILDTINMDMSFGSPQAIHDRHPHDYTKDLLNEFWGIYANQYFYTAIQNMKLVSKDQFSAFTEIIVRLRSTLRFINPGLEKYFRNIYPKMHMWFKMTEALR